MYSEVEVEVPIELLEIANGIAEWSITRYGYFIKADADKIKTIKAFAEELLHLPTSCLGYIDKAKHKWVDEGHKHAPKMPEFLEMLRGFRNAEVNDKPKPKLGHNGASITSQNACAWDGCTTDKDKKEFMRNRYSKTTVGDATKYWIRAWLRELEWPSDRITSVLGKGWS